MTLATLEQAKRQLMIVGSEHDEDVTEKLAQASDIVRDYIGDEAAEWTADTAPPRVVAAVMLTLSSLFDDGAEARLPDGAKDLLRRTRRPVIG